MAVADTNILPRLNSCLALHFVLLQRAIYLVEPTRQMAFVRVEVFWWQLGFDVLLVGAVSRTTSNVVGEYHRYALTIVLIIYTKEIEAWKGLERMIGGVAET